MRALVFPGQGSQYVGMGKELYDAFPFVKEVFEEVDEALKFNLKKLIFNGPSEDLTKTEFAQPALMTVSAAVLKTLENHIEKPITDICAFVAGHSLGEYSALYSAKFMSLSDTARILRIRGQAMQSAVPVGEGGMAAILGMDFETIEIELSQLFAQEQLCVAANDNAPGQVVISGSNTALDQAISVLSEKGAKRAVRLPVSAPFHSPFMKPAAERVKEALIDIHFSSPNIPLIANVTAKPTQNIEDIQSLLVQQITAKVRWRETIEFLVSQNINTIVEIGAGKVLSGLNRRISRDIQSLSIETPQDIESFCKTL